MTSLLIKILWRTEDEYIIDIPWPYTVKAMADYKDRFTITPVLAGTQNESKEQEFRKLHSKYLVQHCPIDIECKPQM